MSEFDVQMKGILRKIEGISSVADEVAKGAAPQLATLIQRQFDRGVNPNGERWAPLAPATRARGRKSPPLTDTGEMRHTVECTPGKASIKITVDAPARYHQDGTTYMPSRQILPEGGALPRQWMSVLKSSLKEVLDAY